MFAYMQLGHILSNYRTQSIHVSILSQKGKGSHPSITPPECKLTTDLKVASSSCVVSIQFHSSSMMTKTDEKEHSTQVFSWGFFLFFYLVCNAVNSIHSTHDWLFFQWWRLHWQVGINAGRVCRFVINYRTSIYIRLASCAEHSTSTHDYDSI